VDASGRVPFERFVLSFSESGCRRDIKVLVTTILPATVSIARSLLVRRVFVAVSTSFVR
jgi:hypothetical protein